MWRDAEGETLYTLTIITTAPNALLRPIDNRMPVIFDKLLAKQWLELVLDQAMLASQRSWRRFRPR